MEENNKSYRPNVAAIILSSAYPEKCEIFIGERSDIEDAWQFPQGGVDEGENIREALLRELKEEIGTDDIEIIAEHPEWVKYDFPETVAQKMYPYDGQKQKYFLVRLQHNNLINIKTDEPEFAKYRFISADEVLNHVSYFKKPIYSKVFRYFKKNGYL